MAAASRTLLNTSPNLKDNAVIAANQIDKWKDVCVPTTRQSRAHVFIAIKDHFIIQYKLLIL